MSETPTASYSLHYPVTTSQRLTSTTATAQLFGPELYPLYINWQIDIEDPEQAALYRSKPVWRRIVQAVRKEELGGMPSAQTFKAFMNTKRVKKQLYMNDAEGYLIDGEGEDEEEKEEETPDLLTTRLCRHAVHPGSPWMTTEICPVCLMSQCITSLERIAHVWRLVGGPLKPCRSGNTGVLQIGMEELNIHYAVKRIWYAEKARWANLVNLYERYAQEERSWEEDSQQIGLALPQSINESSSCIEAFELAAQTPFLAEGWGEIFTPKRRLRLSCVGDQAQETSIVGDKEIEVPYSPPNLPKPELETLRYFDRTFVRIEESDKQIENGINVGDTTLSPSSDSTVPPRSPSTSSQSSIYAPSPPPIPPCSPHGTPTTFGVYFPDDLPSPPSRRSAYYQRSSPFYEPGQHVSPPGSTWADTSFMRDRKYDGFGVEHDEDEETESESSDESDSSDNKDDGYDGDDLIVHTDEKTVGQKRPPDQVLGVGVRRPVFSFSWQKHPKLEETHEKNDHATSDEFEDEEAEQAMRDIAYETMEAPIDSIANTSTPVVASAGAEEMGTVSPAEPETQASRFRRSHDEFNEIGETEEKDHVKRPRHEDRPC